MKAWVDIYRVRFQNGRVVAVSVPFDSCIPETKAKIKALEVLARRKEPASLPIQVSFVRRQTITFRLSVGRTDTSVSSPLSSPAEGLKAIEERHDL